MPIKIIIQGKPKSGKTTLIKEIISKLSCRWSGFYTEEIRVKNNRVGFKITNMKGQETNFAHVKFPKLYRVGKYGVDISKLELIGIENIKNYPSPLIYIIDEIGKMELLSDKFREFINSIFESNLNILATMKINPDKFCESLIRKADYTFILERKNYQEIRKELFKLLVPFFSYCNSLAFRNNFTDEHRIFKPNFRS